MIAIKRIVTIENPRELILNDLPFQAGQRIEVVMLAEDYSPEGQAVTAELRTLFRETQALPQVQTITEEEIALEIAAYRTENENRH